MARTTWIDEQLDEVQSTIEQQAAQLQAAGNSINASQAVLAAIPTQQADMIAAVDADGTEVQKVRLEGYTQDFLALKGIANTANVSAPVQALRDLEV